MRLLVHHTKWREIVFLNRTGWISDGIYNTATLIILNKPVRFISLKTSLTSGVPYLRPYLCCFPVTGAALCKRCRGSCGCCARPRGMSARRWAAVSAPCHPHRGAESHPTLPATGMRTCDCLPACMQTCLLSCRDTANTWEDHASSQAALRVLMRQSLMVRGKKASCYPRTDIHCILLSVKGTQMKTSML